VIHRDIKPLNVLLQGDVASGQYVVKVTDFGVAADASSEVNRTAETGTYRWMAVSLPARLFLVLCLDSTAA
jgi:serine/threonine protein kinase